MDGTLTRAEQVDGWKRRTDGRNWWMDGIGGPTEFPGRGEGGLLGAPMCRGAVRLPPAKPLINPLTELVRGVTGPLPSLYFVCNQRRSSLKRWEK